LAGLSYDRLGLSGGNPPFEKEEAGKGEGNKFYENIHIKVKRDRGNLTPWPPSLGYFIKGRGNNKERGFTPLKLTPFKKRGEETKGVVTNGDRTVRMRIDIFVHAISGKRE
jgi:hypothetical protein